MKFLFNIGVLVVFSYGAVAQNSIDSVLYMVERNNTSLEAARKNTEAEKTANRTGIFLTNPEAEFAFLKADAIQPVKRTDFRISQTFDFPSAYGFRSKISKLMNEQADLNYESERRSVLLKARLICSELIYRNALHVVLEKRLEQANELATAYRKMLDAGEANILEYNRAQLNLATIDTEVEINETEIASLRLELAALNGGKSITFTDSIFQTVVLNNDFEEWYKSVVPGYTSIQWLAHETDISIKQEKLNTALSLPRLSAGFMSENVPGEAFRGVTAGISIPLWENRNTVKYAKARTSALKSMHDDLNFQLRKKMQVLYERTTHLQTTVNSYRERMNEFNSETLLTKALNSGQISLSEYLTELASYYNAVEKLLEMERDLDIAYSELIQLQ